MMENAAWAAAFRTGTKVRSLATPESPESKIMRRVNEQALSNGTQAIMDMNPGMSEAEARGEAERMLMVADGVADSDNLTLLRQRGYQRRVRRIPVPH